MKNLPILGIFLMTLAPVTEAVCQKENDVLLVESRYGDSTTLEPSEVRYLEGRNRQKKPTWAIIEGKGGEPGTMGILTKDLSDTLSDEHLTKYNFGNQSIFLPNDRYLMSDSILRDHKSRKIECLILDVKERDNFTSGLVFKDDSMTVNTLPTYKMVLALDPTDPSIVWRGIGSYLFPTISTDRVDSVDVANQYVYGIAIKTKDGVIHEPFWTEVEEIWQLNKLRLYSVDAREGLHFKMIGDTYQFNNMDVSQLIILRDKR